MEHSSGKHPHWRCFPNMLEPNHELSQSENRDEERSFSANATYEGVHGVDGKPEATLLPLTAIQTSQLRNRMDWKRRRKYEYAPRERARIQHIAKRVRQKEYWLSESPCDLENCLAVAFIRRVADYRRKLEGGARLHTSREECTMPSTTRQDLSDMDIQWLEETGGFVDKERNNCKEANSSPNLFAALLTGGESSSKNQGEDTMEFLDSSIALAERSEDTLEDDDILEYSTCQRYH
ncbi:hypothetical protein KIN20_022621 [Parelaphostrongylus tenuis]|uniref:Uncharacterized protein n=1 Tax=Parelaphostrongylus tenuis TaxID=148309 RepID=A0AAD5N6B2_PARTN|nr:hypothetical protein KIN20_022621 [Parelaphostrongylus tenuis]